MAAVEAPLQLRRLPSIPAMQSNNQVVEILQRLQESLNRVEQRINSMDQSLSQRINSMDQSLDNLDRRINSMDQRMSSDHEDMKSFLDTRDRNAQARIHNSWATITPGLKLMALWSLINNDVIPNFPENLDAINRLEEVDLHGLLHHLVRVPPGRILRSPEPNREAKLAAFKCEIGITR